MYGVMSSWLNESPLPGSKPQSWVQQWEKHSMEMIQFFERQDKGIFSRQALSVQGQAELPIPTESWMLFDKTMAQEQLPSHSRKMLD